MMSPTIFYVGTYTQREAHMPGGCGRGVLVCSLDSTSGAIELQEVYGDIVNPSYLHRSADWLYAVSEQRDGGELHILDISRASNVRCVWREHIDAAACCHVISAKSKVWISSYGSGKVACCDAQNPAQIAETDYFAWRGSGPNPRRQEASHLHQIQISPTTPHVYAIDLGGDRIYQLQSTPSGIQEVAAFSAPPGSGPRHGVFHPVHPRFYVLCELEPCLLVYDHNRESGVLRQLAIVPFSEQGQEATGGAAAAIRIHPSGSMLYISERLGDSIRCFHLGEDGVPRHGETFNAGGKTPRDIQVDPTGQWLLIAHQNSNHLVTVPLDTSTGAPRPSLSNRTALESPVCICF